MIAVQRFTLSRLMQRCVEIEAYRLFELGLRSVEVAQLVGAMPPHPLPRHVLDRVDAELQRLWVNHEREVIG